ncbi:hypothetical protein [Neobacillus cucumis]|nr:hypothetical protein [Neobacillus cucumis]
MKQLSRMGILAIGIDSAIPFILSAIGMYISTSWSDHRGGNRAYL